MNNKEENNTNSKYKLNILISLCLILLIIVSLLLGFIFFNNKSQESNKQTKNFIENINLDITLQKTKEIDINMKDVNLDVEVYISRIDENNLKYNFQDNLNNLNYYLYFDEQISSYVSNIPSLDYSDNILVNNYIDELFNTYISNFLFYESKLNSLNINTVTYTLIDLDKLLIKDKDDNYLLINNYGLILEEKLNNSSLEGSYYFVN